MNKLLNISSNPHIRSSLTTRRVMIDVIIGLVPATIVGVAHFGLWALAIIAASIASAVLTEYIFCLITKRKNTIGDCSAVVTGLLLALCLPPTVPIYIPILGSVFAILFAKCLFGGLGQNFMNPALAGRAFLLISFGIAMTDYGMDAESSATPLARIAEGIPVDLLKIFIGTTNGIIGLSAAGILIGGIWLLVRGHITWHIPVAYIGSFLLMMIFFGGHGVDPAYLAAELCAGGVMLGAFFMATDPVTSPMTGRGMLIFGVIVGLLSAIFRIWGSSADSVSFAIIISNLLVPLIDRVSVPKPFGVGAPQVGEKKRIPKAAVTLAVITLIAGAALGLVNHLTKDAIAEQEAQAALASYAEVIPGAENFDYSEEAAEYIASLEGAYYGDGAFGKTTINNAVIGTDASGNVVGYAISATSGDGFDGTVTVSVGFSPDGTLNGIAFTELHETAGMGMEADKPAFKDQFAGVNVESFTMIKGGGASGDDQIDAISGASITSGAVVEAVNASIDFFLNQLQ